MLLHQQYSYFGSRFYSLTNAQKLFMKATFFLSCLVLLLSSCLQNKQESIRPAYVTDSKAVIKLIAQNIPDTANIYFQLHKLLPEGMEKPDKIQLWGNRTAYIHFSIDRPTKAELAIGDSVINCFTAPADTTTILLSFNPQRQPILSFKGATAPFNQYYQEKSKKLGYQNMNRQFDYLRHDNMNMRKFRQGVEKISKREKRFLETYSSKHPLPSWFLEYEQAEIEYFTTGYLLQIPSYYQTFNLPIGAIPDSYYSFLKKVEVNNPKAVLSGGYFFFLSQYFLQNESADQWEGLSGYKRSLVFSNIMLKKANQHLSGPVREVFLSHQLSRLLPRLPASYPLDSILTAFQLQDSGLFDYKRTSDTSASSLANRKLLAGDTVPNFYAVNSQDSLMELRQFSNKVIYLNVWASWCKPCIKSIPEKHALLERMKEEEDFLLLNLCIDSKKDKWKEIINQYKMQGLNLYAEGKWSQKLKESFQIQSIPQYLLLSKGNKLVENHTTGPTKIDSLILQQLKTPEGFLTASTPGERD